MSTKQLGTCVNVNGTNLLEDADKEQVQIEGDFEESRSTLLPLSLTRLSS